MDSFTCASIDTNSRSLNSHHRWLLNKYKQWLNEVSDSILAIVPETEEIWCHGSVALDAKHGGGKREWEFVALLPKQVGETLVESLNDFNSPLDQLREVGGRAVEVETALNDANTPFSKVVMEQGFPVWFDGD